MPDATTAYYMLAGASPAPATLAGYDQDGHLERIAADPRRLMPSEVLTHDPEQGLLGHGAQLLRLHPDGTATQNPADPDGFECLSGWTVTAASSDLAPVLGPQAPQILAVIARAEQAITAGGGPDWDTYVDTTDAAGGDDDTAEAFAAADAAARKALADVGADSWFWSTIGAGAYGPEILALAARDLIGQAPGWTRAAYDLLTRPWSAAFGPAHPDDPVPAAG
jgi:nucleotide-binding universal stress UspA family protein